MTQQRWLPIAAACVVVSTALVSACNRGGGGGDAPSDKSKSAALVGGNLSFDVSSSRATFSVGMAKGSFCRAQGELTWEKTTEVPSRFRFLLDDPRPAAAADGGSVDVQGSIRLLGSSVTFEATKLTKKADGKFEAEGSLTMGELRVPVRASLEIDVEAGGVVRGVRYWAAAEMDREGAGEGRVNVDIRIDASPKGSTVAGKKPPECGG